MGIKVGILGTRGIPANYGGFETFAEELAVRLVRRGHQVTVYGRSHFVDPKLTTYRGVRIRVLPAIRQKYLETVSHTALSVLYSCLRGYDVCLVCNAANAFLCWLPRLAGQKVVLNVDGIERKRKKWNWAGRSFHRMGESLAVRLPDCFVTDARTTQQYYRRRYGRESPFIPYGAPLGRLESREVLLKLGLEPDRYLLYVSRLEPENNAHRVIRSYRESGLELPLVVVGDAPYNRPYIENLRQLAQGTNVLLPGAIYGQGYRELLSHCRCYVYGGEIGGIHPGLLEAMGAGCLVLVNDIPENREAVGDAGLFYPFNQEAQLAQLMARVCGKSEDYRELRKAAQDRVRRRFDWERIAEQYEELFYGLL